MFTDIKGYEGLYSIDEFGNIISLHYGKQRLLKSGKDKDGYLMVILCNQGKNKTLRVHRLVAINFIPNPYNLPIVLHLDNNPLNCHKDNLKWGTYQENMDQMYKDGRNRNLKGIDCFYYGKFGKDHIRAKKVNQYTKEGVLIKTWDCLVDIKLELGIHHSGVSQCIHGKRKTAGGFIWK